ncbi:MAG: hypothetical protein JO250_14510 [Armatimonadetes bacterium]|nr:hypothetical protein [Armatimonadota bacterium]
MPEHSLVVQFRTEGWGSVDDLDRRHRLEDVLDARLRADGNGECDGGDIGSGTVNIYLEGVIESIRAVEGVVAVLREVQALDGAVIAQARYLETEEPEEKDLEGYTVLWPPGYKAEFDIMYL